MTDAQEAAQELLRRREARQSIKAFAHYMGYEGNVPALHHEFLLDNVQEVFDGIRDRLMVFMPPGMAKSTYCSILLPAFYMGKYPDKRIISASYDSSLVEGFGGKVRNMIAYNERYNALFPGLSLSQDTKAKGHWNIKDRYGGYYATGVNSAVTGRRAHMAVLDDLVKGQREADSATVMEHTWRWLKTDLGTRLLPDARVILIMTRWSQNDPPGRLLPEDWNGESGDIECSDGRIWRVVCLPAEAREKDPLQRKPGEFLWTDYYDETWWELTKQDARQSDVRFWSSLYQQTPAPEEGIEFRREWFKWYNEPPKHYTPYMAMDCAVTKDRGDFTEIGVFGVDRNDDLYVAPDFGWWSGKKTPDVWIDAILDLVEDFRPQVLLGEKGVIRNATEGPLDKRMTERHVYVATEWLSHIGDKTANARAFQARAAQGKVYLPNNDIGRRILKQLLEFPAGKHDDIVDVCGLMGRHLQDTVTPSIQRTESVIIDRWEKAFQRKDMTAGSWKTA